MFKPIPEKNHIMGYSNYKVVGSIKLPRYSDEERLLHDKIKSGIMLTQKEYDIIAKDLKSVHDISSYNPDGCESTYLRVKYGSEFKSDKINEALERVSKC